MRSLGHVARWAAATLLAGATFVAPASTTPMATGIAHAADTLGAGGEYHALTPARVYDSRPGYPGSELNNGPTGARTVSSAGTTFDVQLLGQGGIPASGADVLGAVVNIVVVDPSTQGYLNAYGSGEAAGTAAIINFVAGQNVPNLAIVRPGANGKLTIKLAAGTGTANVVVDVFGWFSTSSSSSRGARLVAVTPGRIFDSRTGQGKSSVGPLAAREQDTIKIRGVDATDPARVDIVPDDPNVVGVVLNMAGVNDTPGSTGTYLSVVPEDLGGKDPGTANLNLVRNQVKSNMVIVPVGADGNIRLFNYAGTTNVVLDVVGYLIGNQPIGTRAGRVVPLASPFRVFDTREAQWGASALGPGAAEKWSFADFAASVTIGGTWVGNQSAVIGNLAEASLTRQYASQPVASYITVYPADSTRPTSANLNFSEGQIVPNMSIMKYASDGSYTVNVYNYQGNLHYVYDASAVVLSD